MGHAVKGNIERGTLFLLSSFLAPTPLSGQLAYTVHYRQALPATANRMCCIAGGRGCSQVRRQQRDVASS
jgi:hypothetical protein